MSHENDESDDYEDETEENDEDLVDDLTYDVRNLVAASYHAIKQSKDVKFEEYLEELASRSTQLLVNRSVSSVLVVFIAHTRQSV
jgi:hypothetical protein